MSEEKKKYTKLYLVLTILAIISCFVVFVSIGKDINSPFNLTLKLESPDFACSDSKENTSMGDSKGVVIDKEGQRLTVIDENRNFYSQMKFDLSNQYLNRARSACLYGDDLYVFGYLYDTNGIYYSEQRIVKFHTNGSFNQVVYSESTNSDRFNTSWIYDFSVVNDVVYFVEYDYKTVSINKLESKPSANSGTVYEKKT
ncbi:MAG: hypothetical protein Q4E88_04080 [Coriobacteriia bacterium]|nr:hypothetical protein [Coriobacteriia bacterium]